MIGWKSGFVLALCLAPSLAAAQDFERILGATACLAVGYNPVELSSAPDADAPPFDSVPDGICYPTGGCRDGWCAVEGIHGMGYLPEPGVTIQFPIYEGPFGPFGAPAGVYVLRDVACDAPPNFAFRTVTIEGLAGSATKDCILRITERDGALSGGSNVCTDLYSGRRTSAAVSVRTLGPQAFRLAEDGRIVGEFRFCPTLDVRAYLVRD